MIRATNQFIKYKFRVQVGHSAVVVEGFDRSDAIAQARRRFCHDMPRLWDVIQKLEEEKFEVSELN